MDLNKLILIPFFFAATFSNAADQSQAVYPVYIQGQLRDGQELTRAYELKTLAETQTSCNPVKQDCRTLERRYEQTVPYTYSKSFSDQFSTQDRGNGTCYFMHNEATNSYNIYQDLDRDGVIDSYVPANDNVKVDFSPHNPLQVKVYGITLALLGTNLGVLSTMTFHGTTSEVSGILLSKDGNDGERACWLNGNEVHNAGGMLYDLAKMSAPQMEQMITSLQTNQTCGDPIKVEYTRSPLVEPTPTPET